MKEIEVTLYQSEQKIVTIDSEQINFIQPGLGQTFIHFIDGQMLTVVESEKELVKQIPESLVWKVDYAIEVIAEVLKGENQFHQGLLVKHVCS